jgi:hypothetical protein
MSLTFKQTRVVWGLLATESRWRCRRGCGRVYACVRLRPHQVWCVCGMFCVYRRTKMFRFVEASKEWKERGTGDVRFLRHKENKKIRVLMRAEKTLRVRANHPCEYHLYVYVSECACVRLGGCMHHLFSPLLPAALSHLPSFPLYRYLRVCVYTSFARVLFLTVMCLHKQTDAHWVQCRKSWI